jgi:asparagine synthase (glutamine-hydrolysing)
MIGQIGNMMRKVLGSRSSALFGLSDGDLELISGIRKMRLTYLSDRKLRCLLETSRSIEQRELPGIFVEAGCALGGSAILISHAKAATRPFFVYDVFGMIPPPTNEDTADVHDRYRTIVGGNASGIGPDKYYGYEENLYGIVQANLRSFGIDCAERQVLLIKGLLQDTMRIDQPVALAHVDVDWYEPVMTCLERIWPKIVVGGAVILDDYHDWGGCRKAADEYLRRVAGQSCRMIPRAL